MEQLFKNVKLIAVLILAISFQACDEDDIVLPKVISDFSFTLNEETGTVTFINTSEEANTYEWDFGDGETSKEINPIKTYTKSGTYTISLKATNNAGASTTFKDEIIILIREVIALPITFDDDAVDYKATVFEGASFEVVANPDTTGSNAVASNVGKITNSGTAFEGFFFELGAAIDLSENKTIQMNFWSETAVDVLLKLEEGTGADTEITASHGGTGWEMISFNFTSDDSYTKFTLFVDGPGTTAGTFYIDDIEQLGAAPPATCTDTMLALPMDFDCDSLTYNFVTFNGASYSVVDNPQLSGVNNVASKVGEIVNSGGAFEGGAFTLDTPVDFSTDKAITMKVYSTVALPVLLKFEGVVAPIEVSANHGGTGWEQLTFTFTSSDQFTTLVLFIDGPGTTAGTFYIDDIEQVPATPACTDTMLALPIDFDCDSLTYNFVTFNGASYSVVDNPQLSGVNNVASKVGEIVNIGGAFEGGAFTLDTPVDFSTDKAITMKVYSTVALPVLLKFEGVVAPIEVSANHGGTGWEQLTFTFTSSDQFTTLVLFIDGPGTTAGTFYIDDIEQVPATPACTETMLELPIDFDCESLTYNFVTFNGASYSVVDNPQLSGVNNVASKVGEIVNIGGAFEGGAFTLDTPVDFSTDKAITMKVYSTVALPVLLKFEGVVAPIEVSANHGGTGWEQLTFTFTSSDQFTTLVLFIDGPGTTAGTFYIDDIEQIAENSCPAPPVGDLVSNGDFETGTDSCWELFQNGGSAAVDNTMSNGGGSNSGRLVINAPGNPAFKQNFIGAGTVSQGDVVQIQFDHIGTIVPPGAVFNVLLFGEQAGPGASFTHVFNPAPALSGTWSTFTGTFTIPAVDVSGGLSFLIEAVCGGDVGCSVTANIDNVSVTIIP